MDKAIKAIAARAGGVKALAAALGITPAAIYQWERVPPEKALEVSRLAKMPVEPLLPAWTMDLFRAMAKPRRRKTHDERSPRRSDQGGLRDPGALGERVEAPQSDG